MNDYKKTDEYTDKQHVKIQVMHHRSAIRESLDILHDYTNQVEEFAYAGDILQTLRLVEKLRDEAKHLHNTVDHLLLTIEDLHKN